MTTLFSYIPLLTRGALVTLGAWCVAGIISLSIGTLLGIVSCNYRGSTRLGPLIKLYTFIAKGIPAYVQILIAYFVIPSLVGIPINGFIAATGALAFCSGGYVTEIIRAGINSIPRGQWDAGFVLGYSFKDMLRRIILPQTFKNVLPALLGESEQLLKSTSLLATIGITELTRSGMNIISRELNPIPVYLTIAGLYLLFSGILTITLSYVEKRAFYGYR